jgi:protease-4
VEDFSKPIVVSTAASNASAAYLISSQADYIYANEASAVGAIGTAMQLMDYSQLLDLLGIDAQTITSAESKDATYGYRSLTDEERAYFQAQVDQINKNFIKVVAQGRGMTTESVEKLATGLSFTGEDAVENGLIDEIGTYQDACTKAASMAGVCSYRVESLGSSDVGLVDLLAALLLNTSDTNSTSNTEIQEGASVNGQLS